MSLLEEFAPTWQFHEVHRIGVLATAERAYQAVQAVTAREILFFRMLSWLRRLGRKGAAESILNPPPDAPILDVATRTGFLLLGTTPREIAVGTVVIAPPGAPRPRTPEEFRAIDEKNPGYAKAVMNFRIQKAGLAMCVVTTETRVFATDPRTRRKFAMYWWTINPGSALIRRMWLRAIRRRAEVVAG